MTEKQAARYKKVMFCLSPAIIVFGLGIYAAIAYNDIVFVFTVPLLISFVGIIVVVGMLGARAIYLYIACRDDNPLDLLWLLPKWWDKT